MFPTMTQADIDRLRRFGESKFYETGGRIVRAGQVAPGLIIILSGKVEVTQGCGPEQRETIVTHPPGQFVRELAQLSARPSLVDADALEPVQALVVRSDRLRDLLVQEAELRDGEIAETVHCMNKTNKAFRLIVMRRPREQDLFEEKSPYRYHAIASNRANEDAAATMEWYSRRGDASENRIKDLKGIHALWFIPGQRRILRHRRADLQFVSRLSLPCAWKRVGVFASANRALAVVPDGGKDRPPWPANVVEGQRSHVGDIRRDS
jgi:CRP-like cAMP-binding protein